MKKYTSIFMLLAGSTILPLAGLLLLMALAEGGLFYLSAGADVPFDQALREGHTALVSALVLVLWMVVLLLPRFSRGGMTLARLQVSPRAIYLCHALYNALTLCILWGFQVLAILGLGAYYGRIADPQLFGPQTVMLAFYREEFLHGLLPLADWMPWARNIAFILALGFAAAYPATDKGRGRHGLFLAAFITVAVIWSFPAKLNGAGALLMLICALGTALLYGFRQPTYGGGGEE